MIIGNLEVDCQPTKRLMVLGAGLFQIAGIRKAASLGYHVITVDHLPDNVGHKHGHQQVNCSTVEIGAVLRAAKALQIHGICTFSSDVAVPSVAHVCAELGLRGAAPNAALTMATKNLFRAFLLQAGLPCPRFASGSDFEAVAAALGGIALPLVVKPVDTSGSRGITLVERPESSELKTAFLKAQGFSPSGNVCVEQFVAGTEVGGDAILIDGRIAFCAITHKHLRGFVVTGHSMPTNISPDDQRRVIATLEETCAALDYRNGPLNYDAIVSKNSVTLLEISPRNGGNGIAEVIFMATGVDVEVATIHLALGEIPELPATGEVTRGIGSLVFGSSIGGRLDRICTSEELLRKFPAISSVQYVRKPGDLVGKFEHNGNLIGFTIFACRDADEYQDMAERILETLDIVVSPN